MCILDKLFYFILNLFLKQFLKWLKNKNGDSIISCITHSEDFQLWNLDDSSPYLTISRNTISRSMSVSSYKFK